MLHGMYMERIKIRCGSCIRVVVKDTPASFGSYFS